MKIEKKSGLWIFESWMIQLKENSIAILSSFFVLWFDKTQKYKGSGCCCESRSQGILCILRFVDNFISCFTLNCEVFFKVCLWNSLLIMTMEFIVENTIRQYSLNTILSITFPSGLSWRYILLIIWLLNMIITWIAST